MYISFVVYNGFQLSLRFLYPLNRNKYNELKLLIKFYVRIKFSKNAQLLISSHVKKKRQ